MERFMLITSLAYINDLPDSLKSSDTRLFADDSLLPLTVNGANITLVNVHVDLLVLTRIAGTS